MFFMLTLLAYDRYVRRPTVLRYTAVFLLLALGLMSKPMLVTVPLVLLLLDYWPLGRMRLRSVETVHTRHLPVCLWTMARKLPKPTNPNWPLRQQRHRRSQRRASCRCRA